MAFKAALEAQGMSETTYWLGSFVGNHCRKFASICETILGAVRDVIAQMYPDSDEATIFFDRHCGILKCLNTIGHYTRLVDMLSETQIEQLRVATVEYSRLCRIAYPNHQIFTPKSHFYESHLMDFVAHFGTVGIFGEDGMEALHPMDTRARMLVRSMRNPVQRHMSLTKALSLQQQQHKLPEEPKKKRRNKSEIAADLAAAAEIAVAEEAAGDVA